MNYLLKTPNFTFKLRVEDVHSPIHLHRFTLGDGCLNASLLMPDVDERFAKDLHICNIMRLDALETCLLDPPDTDASMGMEILYAFISIIKSNYRHITHITLRDSSYIPCNRIAGDTLDVLSYNIALYGKTWYEMTLGAYIENQKDYDTYKTAIAFYTSQEAKQSVSWDAFYADIARKNGYAGETIKKDEEKFRHMFERSHSWPECIQTMKMHISKEDKCKFFKSWLESFVYSYVPNSRDWIVNIKTNSVLKNVLNSSS